MFSQQPIVTITANPITRTYDGTAAFAVPTFALTGLVDAALFGNAFTQDVSSGSLAVTSPSKNVGIYGVGLGTLTVPSGYQINYSGANASVTPAALTITAPTVTKTYDGTTLATGSGSVGSLAGALAGESVGSAGSLAFLNRNAGAGNKVVRASGVTIKDSANADVTGNYVMTYVDNTASTITPAPLTVSTSNISRVYDGTTIASGSAVVKVGNLFGTDALTGGSFAFADKNVGNGKTVNVSGISVNDGNGGNNYAITQVANTANRRTFSNF